MFQCNKPLAAKTLKSCTIWCDHFKDSLPPSQYAGWLRLYPPDIIAEASSRTPQSGAMFNTYKRMTSKDVIRYCPP